MFNFKLNLSNKLTLIFILLVVVSLIISVTSSLFFYRTRTLEEIKPRLDRGEEIFRNQIINYQDKALIQAEILKDEPDLLASLQNLEVTVEDKKLHTEIFQNLAKIKSKTDLDILEVVDNLGKVVARAQDASRWGDFVKENSLIMQAFKGEKTKGVERVDNQIRILAAVPIRSNNRLVGILVSGYFLDDNLLAKLKTLIEQEVAVYTDQNVSHTTIIDEEFFQPLNITLDNKIIEKLKLNEEVTQELKIFNRHFLVRFFPLRDDSNKIIAYVMIGIPTDPILAATNQAIRTLIYINLIMFALAIFFARVLAHHIAKPIEIIQKGTEIVAAGNFDHRIVLNTRDESQQLAEAFNRMTARLKSMVEELELVNEKSQALLQSIVEGVMALDDKNKIILFNKAAVKITGWEQEDVLNKPYRDFLRFEDKDGNFFPLESCFRPRETSSPPLQLERLKTQSKTGKTIYLDLNAAPIRVATPEQERVKGCIITFHDVTREKEMEEMKLDFVSMAAHELRTPLTALRGYISVFTNEYIDEMNEEQKVFLRRMDISALQLLALMENLLSVARIERHAVELKRKPLAWELFVAKIVSGFVERAKEKGLKLKFTPSKTPLPPVKADSLRITEVLNNLLANAVTYTQKGRIEVYFEVDEKQQYVITHIKDTGRGIPKEALPNLFTKFYRVSGVLEEGSKGTGLGLYISKTIVELHKGKIWVESTLGKGSTFSFSIPVAKKLE